jgi:hypothetical protein
MMKRKNLALAIFLCSCFCNAESQGSRMARNSVFFELFGNGGLYSLNYERAMASSLYTRIGFATWNIESLERIETKMTTVPLLITHITGKKNSHLEFGGGFLFGSQNKNNMTNPVFDLTGFLGYRYQRAGKGFIFRTGATPFISLSSADYPDRLMLSLGLSFGYHF